ncbi:MAG: hypothetical protein H6648_03755 [Caldilineae bacterium]|nr:hypothetical protein [Chloroflexota bacterium]MCB9176250.1 hypothetical protein [Caldilineae bacterium]
MSGIEAQVESGAWRRESGVATYREAVMRDWGDLRIWDCLDYDAAGDLWIGDLRVIDAVRRYGTPLEIVDTRIIERRSREWFALTREVAASVGYPGRLDYLYAAKANMASEVTHAAYRSGWNAETSAPQDLTHLRWMADRGLLPAGLRVVCNGFKLPAARHGLPAGDLPDSASRLELPHKDLSALVHRAPYAEGILEMAADGWDIMPILDADELPAFSAPGAPSLRVGLRMKLGKVTTAADLDRHVSRFGLDRDALAAAARAVAEAPNLTLGTLHAMVGAAETIPVEHFAEGLLLGADAWLELRRAHPSLNELNLGGGMPPLGEAYDHRDLLERLMRGILARAEAAGLPAPDLCFELGSLVVAEAGFHVFKVMQRKVNHRSADGGPGLPWALLDGGLMAAIPDMLLIDKPFRFLALTDADAPATRVRFGDPTCDSDGRYPPAGFGAEAAEWLPEVAGETYVCVQGIGAYQEILSGVRGAHHCGLLEAVELILERGADGQPRARLMPRQTASEAAAVLGYTEEAAAALALTLPSGPDPGAVARR